MKDFFKKTTFFLLVFILLLVFLPVKPANALTSDTFKSAAKTSIGTNSPGLLIQPGDEVEITVGFKGNIVSNRDAADIILVMDLSGSMNDPWCAQFAADKVTCLLNERKIVSAKKAMKEFVGNTNEDIPALGQKGDYVGLVTYNGNSWPACSPTSNCARVNFGVANMTAANKALLISVIDGLAASRRTPIGSGIDIANKELMNLIYPASTARPNVGVGAVSKHIVLATDGIQTARPTPYEFGILASTITNKIALYSVGIGQDIYGIGSDGDPCRLCPNGDWTTDGDELMRDIACRVDSFDPVVTNRCNLGSTDADPATNDLSSPRNFFYAPSADELKLIYQKVVNRIYSTVWYTAFDRTNLNVFRGSAYDFRVVDCSNNTPWPTQQFIYGGDAFLVTIESIPNTQEVCVKFKDHVIGANLMVPDAYDYDGDIDFAELVRFGDTLNQSGKRDFPIDHATFRYASPWPSTENCDYQFPFGSLNAIEILRCIRRIDGVLGNEPFALGWIDQGFPLPLGNISVFSVNTPWVNTTGGDVVSQGGFNMLRNLVTSNPDPAGDRNSQYVVFSDGVNTSFSSIKNWLVGGATPSNYTVDLGKFGSYASIHKELSKKICLVRAGGPVSLPEAKGVFLTTGWLLLLSIY